MHTGHQHAADFQAAEDRGRASLRPDKPKNIADVSPN